MITDAVSELRSVLAEHLRGKGVQVQEDGGLRSGARWRPHLLEPATQRAWHCLTEPPDTPAWAQRIAHARSVQPDLRIAICGPLDILQDESVLEQLDHLGAEVQPVRIDEGSFALDGPLVASAADLIHERGLRLRPKFAEAFLDRGYARVLAETNTTKKGVLLEVVTAVVLSQVAGFRVLDRGISSRTQQIDVTAENRNVGGLLGRGSLVLAECKNWANPVGRVEYDALYRKMRTRRGFTKLGFFVTTDRVTRAFYDETLRDSMSDELIVILDKDKLPGLWRSGDSITAALEERVYRAAIDQSPDD